MTAHASEFQTQYQHLFIDGQFVTSTGGEDAVINPATEAQVGLAPKGSVADAGNALAAARHAFDNGPWPDADRHQRADKMQHLVDRIQERKDEAVHLMMLEMGYTRMQCEFQFDLAIEIAAHMLLVARAEPTRMLPLIHAPQADGTTRVGGAMVVHEPFGLVVAITPYNAGILLFLVKVVPALAAGNSVILKPSPFTPLQSLLLTELLAELDLPPGVFNLVTGDSDVGAALCGDPRVDMISFTGSDQVGGQIAAQAGPNITKVHLELGGKSALIVRRDADLQKAAFSAVYANFSQAGQGCAITTRIIVDNRVRSELVAGMQQLTSRIKVGNPFAADTIMGPLIRDSARQRVEMFCQRALEQGASLITGGKRPQGLDNGFYFEPTMFDNVQPDSFLAQNEVFGPIAAIIGFDDDKEAIRIANNSDFGLSGGVFSQDAGVAMNMALKLRTGTVSINGGSGRIHPATPFGGYKRSGLGREWGAEGYYEFTQTKSISFPVG